MENLNISGELDFFSEKISVTNSNGINAFDENTVAIATITTIFELEKDVSGMWFDSNVFMNKLDAYHAGQVSAEKAFSMTDSVSVPSGEYNVVFGRLAFADLIYSRFEVGLGSIELNASPYTLDMLGKQIASSELTIHDNATLENAIGTKSVTDEGLPTQKNTLLKNGVLENFLANDYYAKKFSHIKSLKPSNGFRFGGGGRHYSSEPGIHATNIDIAPGKLSDSELIETVKNGIFIGRIWYTYPVNGLASSDFTSTVRGDSFLIENGKITKAITPNTLRLNENLTHVLNSIIGIGKKRDEALAWGEESVVVTPEIAAKNVRLDKISVGLYS